jgi:ABC-type multidrug transport system ATPase subunit
MIQVRNLSIGFNNSILFDNLDFLVNKGEIFTLTGESGKGKSSIFSVLSGFIVPLSGEVYINNIILNAENIHSIRNLIAWLPQNLQSLPALPVSKQFQLLSSFKRNHNLFNLNEFEELAETFRLKKDIFSSEYSELSGGEKQRLALIYTLLQKKPIILLDEPTSALDDVTEKCIGDYFKSRTDLTVLASSHSDYWISLSQNTMRI